MSRSFAIHADPRERERERNKAFRASVSTAFQSSRIFAKCKISWSYTLCIEPDYPARAFILDRLQSWGPDSSARVHARQWDIPAKWECRARGAR
jgi:hypothetical protein